MFSTKQDVEEQIGYLVNKYFGNTPLVVEDFQVFLSELSE